MSENHSCFRCGRFFIPTSLSPTATTIYCLGCHAASTTLSDTPPPTPPPPPTTVFQTPLPISTQFDFVENDEIAYSYVPRPTPAATSFINTLKKDKLAVDRRFLKQLVTAPSCAICSDEFKLKESVNKLPCRHWFHHDCITRWLTLKNNCPLCRHDFPRQPDHHHVSRSPAPEHPIQAAAVITSENMTERVVQALPTPRRVRLTARIRAGAILPNRRLAEY